MPPRESDEDLSVLTVRGTRGRSDTRRVCQTGSPGSCAIPGGESSFLSRPAAENLYDVIVIGTGPIGQTVADRVRAAELSVAAVEREPARGIARLTRWLV